MCDSVVTAYIGLGSNIGDREYQLNRAVELLKLAEKVQVTAESSYYNTAPVGYEQQPDFLNAVVEIRTSLSAGELLKVCSGIEKELKRERIIHWGPRTIDLDILLYGSDIINDKDLVIPHPRMHERRFVLEPLNEIAPSVLHPVLNKNINEIFHDNFL
ncbi:2-amino-4-hydroxy-6-hydroxymethyldihydropteridine diphosphokinase [Ruminiclostridium papyrosolvens]|nr:2-amino-4-hydroxy-6-hydroxymethyldihydropteridine diphosphokinase [Ruminiclostridium papyrosolvens]